MRYSRIAPKKQKRNYTSAILFLLLVGAGVYILCATAAGSWLADNVVTPVFNYLENGAKQTGINDLDTPSAQPEASLTASAGAKVTESIAAEGKTYYLLQTGSFEDEQNAADAAASLKARGGAGYIYKDGTRSKVILAAYKSENDAKTVKQRVLNEEGLSTYIFSVKMEGLNFSITAADNQVQALKEGIGLPEYAADTLMALSVKYDKSEPIDAEVQALKKKCATVKDNLLAVVKEDEKNAAIVRLKEFTQQLCENINKLPDNASLGSMEISSQLKYTVIWVALNYSDFMKNLV